MAALYIRLWLRLLHDPTVRGWPVGQRWCWVATLLVAAESPEPGTLQSGNGPLTTNDLADLAGVSWDTCRGFLARADRARMLVRRADGVLVVRNWSRYQALVHSPVGDASRSPPGDPESSRKSVGNRSATGTARGPRARDSEQKQEEREIPGKANRGPVRGGDALPDFTFSSPPSAEARDLREIGAELDRRLSAAAAPAGSVERLLEVLGDLDEASARTVRAFFADLPAAVIEHARSEVLVYSPRNPAAYAVGIAKALAGKGRAPSALATWGPEIDSEISRSAEPKA